MQLKASKKRSLIEQADVNHNEQELRDSGDGEFVDAFIQFFNDLDTTLNEPVEMDGYDPIEMNFSLNDYYFGVDHESDKRPIPTLTIDGTLYDIIVYGWLYGSNEWYPIMNNNSMGQRWDNLIQKYGGEIKTGGLWYFYGVGYEH